MTVIDKAQSLIKEQGHKKAIIFFKKRIDDIGIPKSFQDVCNISGNEVAIEFINNDYERNRLT